ncbi:alpha/beta hydrolase [Sphingomonas sp. QA11]|uniref:hypothetical protein n=1 Tax=Sphingomonas sp. QA11 TaxID=2950605 RepID=UPI00234AF664|nr:hypothetical protein [Sphingomonas sp. QA11]WCM27865.1 alpha/beta hydrolase [Sphingomonas sp. QA11]
MVDTAAHLSRGGSCTFWEKCAHHLDRLAAHGQFFSGLLVFRQWFHETLKLIQSPTISLKDDVTMTKRVIDAAESDVILVGHSYGGAVITEAGNHTIPVPAQGMMANRAVAKTIDRAGSHAVYVSQSDVVADFIDSAGRDVSD